MQKRAIQFLSAVLFFGILLSVTLYAGFGALFEGGAGEGFGFNRAFYESKAIGSFRRVVDYRVFGHIEGGEVLIGKDDHLFEMVDSATGFDYLLDYVHGSPFTEAETDAIAHTLSARQAAYEAMGVTYLLAVIPSAYTACADDLPDFLGAACDNTRLKVLSRTLSDRGVEAFLDLSPILSAEPTLGARYHNTEDSINAYGAFDVYGALMDRLHEAAPYRLSVSKLDFTTHYTDGKQIATRVGLSRVITNKTVSLDSRLGGLFTLQDTTEHCITGRMKEGVEGCDRTLVIECSREWDKLQLMPYLSGTFETVVYENRITDGTEAVAYHGGDMFIQVIHEGELQLLLP